jgi:hypothetical protein
LSFNCRNLKRVEGYNVTAPNAYLRIYIQRGAAELNAQVWERRCTSEVRMHDKDPVFAKLIERMTVVCNNNWDKQLRVSVWHSANAGADREIGHFETTFAELYAGIDREFNLTNPRYPGQSMGSIAMSGAEFYGDTTKFCQDFVSNQVAAATAAAQSNTGAVAKFVANPLGEQTLSVLKVQFRGSELRAKKGNGALPSPKFRVDRYAQSEAPDAKGNGRSVSCYRVQITASNLPVRDVFSSDPIFFLYRKYGDKWLLYHVSEVQGETVNPSWESFVCHVNHAEPEPEFYIEAWDWDYNNKPEILGRSQLMRWNDFRLCKKWDTFLGARKSGKVHVSTCTKLSAAAAGRITCYQSKLHEVTSTANFGPAVLYLEQVCGNNLMQPFFVRQFDSEHYMGQFHGSVYNLTRSYMKTMQVRDGATTVGAFQVRYVRIFTPVGEISAKDLHKCRPKRAHDTSVMDRMGADKQAVAKKHRKARASGTLQSAINSMYDEKELMHKPNFRRSTSSSSSNGGAFVMPSVVKITMNGVIVKKMNHTGGGFADPFVRIYHGKRSKSLTKSAQTKVLKNSQSPSWARLLVETKELYPEAKKAASVNKHKYYIYFKCWDWSPGESSHLIGQAKVSLASFEKMAKRGGATKQLELQDRTRKCTATLKVEFVFMG